MPERDWRPAEILGSSAPHAQLTSTAIPNTLDATALANHPLAKWIPFFGVPNGYNPQTAGLSVVRDMYILPEAYRNKPNARLETILIHQISTSRKYPITDLAPLVEWDGALEVVWDEWKFHDHRLSRTPELSVSRLLTSNFSEDRTYMVRYGIMFQLEHGFFMHERGRKQFLMNMQQMSNACIETLCHGVFIQLLSCQPMAFDTSQLRNSVSSEQDRDDLFREELSMANIMVKRANGLTFVWDKLREVISDKSSGLEPNRLVLPWGMMKYASATRPENMFTFLQGKTLSLDRTKELASGLGSGTIVYESQKWRIGEKNAAEDPVYQHRTWGHYHVFDDRKIRNIDADNYKTHMMDVKIFSDRHDNWRLSPYEENVAKSSLFIRHHELRDGGQPYPPKYGNNKTTVATASKTAKPSWELSALGQRFFSPYATCGDFVRATGQLHKWQKVLEKDADRRYKFVRQFLVHSGVKVPVASADTEAGENYLARAKAGKWEPGQGFISNELKQLLAKDNSEEWEKRRAKAAAIAPSAPSLESDASGAEGKPFLSFKAAVKLFFANEVKQEASEQMLAFLLTFLQRSADKDVAVNRAAWREIGQISDLIKANNVGDLDPNIRGIFIAQFGQAGGSSGGESKVSDAYMYPQRELSGLPFAVTEVTNPSKGLLTTATVGPLRTTVVYLLKYIADGTTLPAGTVSSLRDNLASIHPLQWTVAECLRAVMTARNGSERLRDLSVPELRDAVRDNDVARILARRAKSFRAQNETGDYQVDDVLSRIQALFHRTPGVSTASSAPDLGGVDVDGRATLAFQSRVAEFGSMDTASDDDVEEEKDSARRVKEDAGIDAALAQVGVLYKMNKESLQLLYQRLVLSKLAPDGKSKSPDDRWTQRQFIIVMTIIEKMYMQWLQAATSATRRRDAEQTANGKVEALLNEMLAGTLCNIRRQLTHDRYKPVFAEGNSLSVAIAVSKQPGIKLWQSLEDTAHGLYVLQTSMQGEVFDQIQAKIGDYFQQQILQHGSMDIIARLTRSPYEDLKGLRDTVIEGNGPTGVPRSVQDTDNGDYQDKDLKPYVIPILLALPIILMGDLIKFGLENDMWPLLGIRAHRLYATWNMGSAIALIGGGLTCNTLKKQFDFMLGDNPSQKKHMGHLTGYAKTVIWRKDTVGVANNIYPRGYVGGYNDKIWDYTNKSHREEYLKHGHVRENDILPFPVPINEPEPLPYYDVTGKFALALRLPTDPEPYTFAEDMCHAWRIRHAPGNPFKRDFINYNGQAASTTIVFCDHHQRYTQDAHGTVKWEDTWGVGPRGPVNYPGIAPVFRGESMWIQPVNRGGTSVVSIGV